MGEEYLVHERNGGLLGSSAVRLFLRYLFLSLLFLAGCQGYKTNMRRLGWQFAL